MQRLLYSFNTLELQPVVSGVLISTEIHKFTTANSRKRFDDVTAHRARIVHSGRQVEPSGSAIPCEGS
jgi:hypothetical protein